MYLNFTLKSSRPYAGWLALTEHTFVARINPSPACAEEAVFYERVAPIGVPNLLLGDHLCLHLSDKRQLSHESKAAIAEDSLKGHQARTGICLLYTLWLMSETKRIVL